MTNVNFFKTFIKQSLSYNYFHAETSVKKQLRAISMFGYERMFCAIFFLITNQKKFTLHRVTFFFFLNSTFDSTPSYVSLITRRVDKNVGQLARRALAATVLQFRRVSVRARPANTSYSFD